MAYSLVTLAYQKRKNFGFVLFIWKRLGLKMILKGLALFLFTMFAAFSFYQIPFTHWGWYNLISPSGDVGNVGIAPFVEGTKSSYLVLRVVSFFFIALLVLLMPFMTAMEEKVFRRWGLGWSTMVKHSLIFGFLHMIVGVPIYIALALSCLGFFLALSYKNQVRNNLFVGVELHYADIEALKHTTALHTMHNYWILLPLLIVSFLSLF